MRPRARVVLLLCLVCALLLLPACKNGTGTVALETRVDPVVDGKPIMYEFFTLS